ncbi:MAG: hypothetical protein R2912_09985 [Eubacteriales bacterium]
MAEDDIERYDREPRRRFHFRYIKWILRGIVLAAILLPCYSFFPRSRRFLRRMSISICRIPSLPCSPTKMGYNKIDFSNAILGESREKSDFVVLEQDITVTARFQALANLALFEKSQVIRSTVPVFTRFDLSALSSLDIDQDEQLELITIRIPHTVLAYVTVDVENAEFEETKKCNL